MGGTRGTPPHLRALCAAHHHCAGEGVVGTVASLSAVVAAQGWSVDAVLVAVAGTGLTFGMWWVYFVVPQSEVSHPSRTVLPVRLSAPRGVRGDRRDRAGSHAVAYSIGHHSKLSAVGTVLSVAIPVAIYIAAVYFLYMWLCGPGTCSTCSSWCSPPPCWWPRYFFVDNGMSMANSLLIVTLAPAVTVVGTKSSATGMPRRPSPSVQPRGTWVPPLPSRPSRAAM